MDRCRGCHLFDKPAEDDLCRGCRSVRRIRDFFCGGFLLRSQEARAVAALRTCVGELTDLVEIASPILEKEKAEANPTEDKSKDLSGKPSAPEVEGGPEAPAVKTEAVEKDENANETPGVSEVVDKEEDTQGEKKEEKKKKRKKKHPDQKPSKRRLEKKEKKAREREAQIAEDKKESLPSRDEAIAARVLDHLAIKAPSTVGLVPVPRGSVARHYEHLPPPPPAPKRPRSPDHPPGRGNERGRYRDYRGRQGPGSSSRPSGQKKRGTKGAKHRERGRTWPFRAPY